MSSKYFNKIFVVSGLAATAIGASACWYSYYWQPKRTALWDSRPSKSSRSPAQFTETDLPLIDDYFRYNSFHHFISYRLNLDLSSDASKNEQERAHKALDKTVHKLFSRTNKAETLRAFSSPTLTLDFISSYLEQMDLDNVDKGNYQIDLEFIPRNHPSVLFESETRAVSLWDLNQKNSITAAIGEKTPSPALPQAEEFNLIRKIVSTEYPSEGQYYQYQGGVISLQLGLDKLRWDSVAKQTEEAEQLDGDLIYRRYFKIVHEDEFSFFIDHPDMSIANTAMMRTNDDIHVFVTVDVSREFNGHTLEMPKDRLSINFGEMLPTKKRKRGLLQRIFGNKEESVFKTGNFKLFGRLGKGEAGVDFEVTLHTLVYNIQTHAFNPQDSRITVSLKNNGLNAFDKASATNDIKRILLGPMANDLAKSLSLGRFHPSFKVNGGGR